MKIEELKQIINAMVACLPYAKKPDNEYCEGLHMFIGSYPVEVVRAAFLTHLKQTQFMPAPSEILEIIETMERSRPKPHEVVFNKINDAVDNPAMREKLDERLKKIVKNAGGWESADELKEAGGEYYSRFKIRCYQAFHEMYGEREELTNNDEGVCGDLLDNMTAGVLGYGGDDV